MNRRTQLLGCLAAVIIIVAAGLTVHVASHDYGVAPAEPRPTSFMIGSVFVKVGPLRPADDIGAPAFLASWLQHDVTFTNTTDRPMYLTDDRNGDFVGPNKNLFVGDGRGLGGSEGQDVAPFSTADIQSPRIAPHGTFVRTITLAKALPGMGPATPGDYGWHTGISYQQEVDPGPVVPGQPAPATCRIDVPLTYRITDDGSAQLVVR